MRTILLTRRWAWLPLICSLLSLRAGPSPAPLHSARVKADRTNVRIKPTFDSEVLASLRKGEVVEVVEEVQGLGADGKERPWSRIKLPSRVAIWVYGPLLDPKTKTVRTESVHLRAGPGKNYSELGELPHGSPVTVVRELEDWTEIEQPAGLSAFVASSLIESAATVPAVVEIPAPTPVEVTNAPAIRPVVTTIPPVYRPPGGLPPPSRSKPISASTPQISSNPTPAVAAISNPSPASETTSVPMIPLTRATPIVPATETLPTPVTGAVPPTANEPATRPGDPITPREVVREGLVSRAWNIQSPGYFELRSARGEGLINYLVTEDTTLDIKFYLGRLVVITGTEWRDSRWKTPLVKVTAIKLAL